ncbi:hypothetical protein ACQJBY_015973 [Aegilops geniculata]
MDTAHPPEPTGGPSSTGDGRSWLGKSPELASVPPRAPELRPLRPLLDARSTLLGCGAPSRICRWPELGRRRPESPERAGARSAPGSSAFRVGSWKKRRKEEREAPRDPHVIELEAGPALATLGVIRRITSSLTESVFPFNFSRKCAFTSVEAYFQECVFSFLVSDPFVEIFLTDRSLPEKQSQLFTRNSE